jgi:DNA helicase-2/ATP-dependent DNA helicase PcrA
MTTPVFMPSTEQEKVIAHRGGHLQVIACAGAGKTEAISRRVSSLIEEGVEPAQIVAFTFTDRAAAGLKNRITRRIAESKGEAFLDRLSPMFVGTIHAYCLHMLQDHVPEFGNFDILDENKLAGLLSREHKRLELSKLGSQHWRPIFDFLRNADVIENELLDPTPMKGTPFGDCYFAFKQTLLRFHFLTYGLLISAAVKALARPEVYKRVHGPLRHLIVDEYQDINPAQEKLIGLLAQPPVHLCVVADDDQAIYQWRGSDVSNMLEFTNRYKPATSLPLSSNRRSRPTIISTANTFAESISPRLPKKMKPHRPASGPEVHCWAAETVPDEANIIADTIEQLHKKGFRYKDIAILFRSVRTSSPPLIEVFEQRGIPFRCAGRTGLFLQPEASVLGKLYAWLSKNDWKNERYGQSATPRRWHVDVKLNNTAAVWPPCGEPTNNQFLRPMAIRRHRRASKKNLYRSLPNPYAGSKEHTSGFPGMTARLPRGSAFARVQGQLVAQRPLGSAAAIVRPRKANQITRSLLLDRSRPE